MTIQWTSPSHQLNPSAPSYTPPPPIPPHPNPDQNSRPRTSTSPVSETQTTSPHLTQESNPSPSTLPILSCYQQATTTPFVSTTSIRKPTHQQQVYTSNPPRYTQLPSTRMAEESSLVDDGGISIFGIWRVGKWRRLVGFMDRAQNIRKVWSYSD